MRVLLPLVLLPLSTKWYSVVLNNPFVDPCWYSSWWYLLVSHYYDLWPIKQSLQAFISLNSASELIKSVDGWGSKQTAGLKSQSGAPPSGQDQAACMLEYFSMSRIQGHSMKLGEIQWLLNLVPAPVLVKALVPASLEWLKTLSGTRTRSFTESSSIKAAKAKSMQMHQQSFSRVLTKCAGPSHTGHVSWADCVMQRLDGFIIPCLK